MRILILLCALLFSAKGYSVSLAMEENDRISQNFQDGKLSEDATKAIDNLIYEGTTRLRDKGHDTEADQIASDWQYRYHDFLLQSDRMTNVGDHDPVKWLFQTWQTLDSILGRNVMVFTHLDDLWEFAYTIPVVFHCEDHVNSEEYQKHFVMFAGAVSYWIAMGVCAAALFGTPYALICSPVGDVCEVVMVKFIAPKISDKVWGRVCQQ